MRRVKTVGPRVDLGAARHRPPHLAAGCGGALHDGDLDPADSQQKRGYQPADPRSDDHRPGCPHDTKPLPEKPIEVSTSTVYNNLQLI